MTRTWIAEAAPGEHLLQGFVEHIRNKKNIAFLVLRDRSGSIQITVDKAARPDLGEVVDRLTVGSSLSAAGEVVDSPQVRLGGREMLAGDLSIASLAGAMPMMEDSSIDTRLDYRWLDLRTPANQLIFAVQTELLSALRDYVLARGFTEIHTPKLIAAASESGAEVFALDYFGRPAYLSQSPQFYKQMAMAGGLERVFETGPVFRAEKSHTNRHTTEFTGFDIECAWIDSYRDVMALEEGMLAYALERVAERYGGAVREQFGLALEAPRLPFPVVTLAGLHRELRARYGYVPPEGEEGDLSSEAEQLSYRYSQEAFGHEFLFVTDYPAGSRAFYHLREEGVAQGYDLLWRGVEITTGAQREHRYDRLVRQAGEAGLGEDVRFYTEFFRYGCPPHGGFGLGVDRLTMLLLGLSIKEAMFLFRGPNRLTP